MALKVIDVRNAMTSQRLSVVLTDAAYRLRLYYNTRTDSWYIDIEDAAGTVLLAGARVVVNLPLFYQYRSNADLPEGTTFAFDLKLRKQDPTADNNFGGDILLLYAEKV